MDWLAWLQIAAVAIGYIVLVFIYFAAMELGPSDDIPKWWKRLEDLLGTLMVLAVAVAVVSLVGAVLAVG